MQNYKLESGMMLIIAKYLETNNDYINLIKTCKKYKDLLSFYKFNPISDPTLFESIQTQHFYKKDDLKYAKKQMYQYIYWGNIINDDLKLLISLNKGNKNYKYNEFDHFNTIKDRLVCKDIKLNMLSKLLKNTPFKLGNKLFDSDNDNDLNRNILPKNVIEVFEDKNGNILITIISLNQLIYSLTNFIYRDSNGNYKYLNKNLIMSYNINSGEYSIRSKLSSDCLFFKYKSFKRKTLKMVSDFNYNVLRDFFFMNDNSFCNYTKDTNVVYLKRYSIYELNCYLNENEIYYKDYYKNLLKMNYTILLDTWISLPESIEYNLGFVKYIYLDIDNNYIVYDVHPNGVIITTCIKGKIKVFNPLFNTINFINYFSLGLYTRYDFNQLKFDSIYNYSFSSMIDPLLDFIPNRLLIATNDLTKYSCVFKNKYLIKIKKGKLDSY